MEFTASIRMLGIVSAAGVALLGAVYAVIVSAGLLTLPSLQQPIGDPLFSILEVLIILIAPLMVALMVAVHGGAPARARSLSLAALVCMALLAALTCGVHVVTLMAGTARSFEWPSVPYALDVLAWDVFFALSVLFAAPVFAGSALARWIRALLVASGILALAGLSGVVAGDMHLRNIGILGYAGVFPVASVLMALFFSRARPR